MRAFKYKFQLYRYIQEHLDEIYAEAKRIPQKIGMPSEMIGKMGLTGTVSSNHALLTKRVIEAIAKGSREVKGNAALDENVRLLVKEVYGDEYDGAAINTCEAALWVAFETLASPPLTGRGDNYRARYLAPYERHMHHQAGYGRPFPPKYKEMNADRGCTSGEFGFGGKRLNNLDVLIVPLVGARYECHGIKYYPCPLLTDVKPEQSMEQITKAASENMGSLTAVTSLAFDLPGYGYGAKDDDGTPLLQAMLGRMATQMNIPYIADNATGAPFIGVDPRKIGADVILYSMDKVCGAPTSGLIIGKEEVMVPIRRALGIHGDRWGTIASHGKAAYVTMDPGKEALLGLIETLKMLKEQPETFTSVVDRCYEIVQEEFAEISGRFENQILISKSYNCLCVEVNYERTWRDEGTVGIPVFSIEDMYAGSNIFQTGISKMGIVPTVAYDANILFGPGLGTTDEEWRLIEDRFRYGARAMAELIKQVCTMIEIW